MNMAIHLIARSAQDNTCDALQQALLWEAYCAALKRAQQTKTDRDEKLARAAWQDFLRAYLPDDQERADVPTTPALLGGCL
jgi:hypothetical protein